MAARVMPSFPSSKSPTGATRMLAPHPFDEAMVASYHGNPRSRFAHARIQVTPGARLLSGLLFQARRMPFLDVELYLVAISLPAFSRILKRRPQRGRPSLALILPCTLFADAS